MEEHEPRCKANDFNHWAPTSKRRPHWRGKEPLLSEEGNSPSKSSKASDHSCMIRNKHHYEGEGLLFKQRDTLLQRWCSQFRGIAGRSKVGNIILVSFTWTAHWRLPVWVSVDSDWACSCRQCEFRPILNGLAPMKVWRVTKTPSKNRSCSLEWIDSFPSESLWTWKF